MTTIRSNKGEIDMTGRNFDIMRCFSLKRLLAVWCAIAVFFALSATASQAADLLHNSVDTGSNSSKWPSGWGVTGGKYGQFTCDTCHEPNNRQNLKNIRTVIHTPYGDLWPNGQTSVTVRFQNQTGMGDDTSSRASSNRVCEVCHSKNKFHNDNSANNTAGLGHPTPKEVCTTCHAHNTGFKAACGGCHGNPPTSAARGGDTGLIGTPRPSFALQTSAAGAHATHVTGRSLVCDTCHYIDNGGIRMPNQSGTIQIGFFGFGGKVTSGTYVPFTSSRRGYPFAAGTAATSIAPGQTDPLQANRCANIYCHGGGAPGKAPLTGGMNQAPRWDATGQSACGTCHGASSSNSPAMGSHPKHAGSGSGYSYSCDFCHPATDISHVQGNVRWQFSATDPRLSGATYQAAGSGVAVNVGSTGGMAPSAAYGQCANFYCHSNGHGGLANVASPMWGDATGFAGCVGCHGGAAASATPIVSNAHKAHTNNTQAPFNGVKFSCNECHNLIVDGGNTTIINTGLHVNNAKNVDWGSLSNGGASYASSGCSQIYCHSNGKGVYRAPATAWNAVADSTQSTASCDFCHRGLVSDLRPMSSARHTNHIIQSPVGGVRHKAISCDVCHDNTVAPGGTTLLSGGSHLNKAIDVNFVKYANRSGSYNAGLKRCSTTYCHASTNMTWTSTTINRCGDCHNASNVANGLSSPHIKHYNTATLPNNSNGWTAVNASVTNNIFYCGTCHPTNPELSHINGPATPDGDAAEIVLTLPFTPPAGASRPNTVTLGTGQNADGKGYFYSAGTSCDTYCHSDGRGGLPKTTMYWATTTTSCGNCHNKQGDARATATWSGNHSDHIDSNISSVTCNSCHAATASGNNTLISGRRDRHPNGFRNVTGNATAGKFQWSSVAGSCSNVNCHYGKVMIWGGAQLPSDCTGCHNGPLGSASPMAKNAHKAHINNQSSRFNGFNFKCNECHSTVINSSDTIISNTLHINGTRNVAWGPLSNGGATYSAGNCTNIYCHSSGQATPVYRNPTAWTAVADATEGTVKCDYCHDGTGTGGESLIATGKHTRHMSLQSVDGSNVPHKPLTCDRCHSRTVYSTGNTLISGGGLHLNHSPNVSILKFANRTGLYSASTCYTTYCHGRNNPTWTGAALNCGSCHRASNTPSFGLSTTHRKHYNSATVATRTTGWTNANVSTQNGNVFYCGTCHNVNPDTDHVNGPINANGAAAQISFNIPVVPVGAARPNMVTYGTGQRSDGAGYYFSSGTSCDVYCHSDGLGGPGKIKFLWTSTKFRCGECHNSAFDGYTAPTWSKPHTKHIRGYYEAGNANISCYSCHAATVMSNNTSISDKRRHVNGYRNISSTTAFAKFTWNGTTCSNVYCHSDGKATAPAYATPTWTSLPANCTGCHGNATSNGGNNSALSGKHSKHVNSATYGLRCASCHAKTVDPTNDFALKQYTGAKYHVNKARNVVMSAAYGGSWTSPSCTNIYCHSNGQATPIYSNPNWSTLTTTCTSCHGDATSNTLSGKHQNHLNPAINTSLGLGNGLGCVDCHAKTVSNNTTISAYGNHVNRFADFSSAHGGGSSRYNTSSKLCTNIYCHSNGNPASIVYQNPAAWNSATTYGCNGCHGTSNTYAGAPDYPNGGAVPSLTANSHPGHVGVTTDTTICSVCHVKTASRAVSGVLKDYTAVKYHLNGAPNVYFDPAKAGSSASFSQGNGQCSNVSCHGGNITPAWGTDSGKPKCQKCHGYRSPGWNALNGANATNDPKAGAHFNHISSTTYKLSKPLSCAECHASSIALLTDNPNAVGHYDTSSPAEVIFNTLAKTGSLTPGYSAGSCSNTYCHGAGLPASNPPRTNPTWGTPLLTGAATLGDGVSGGSNPGTGDCAQCHGYPPQNDHSATNCSSCHKHLNADNRTFNNPSLHINGTVEGGTCIGCHAKVQGNRADVVNHFKAQSHHIQGATITNDLCYQCHWEANSDGSINSIYHMGIPGGSVSLVVYGAGTGRPASYTTGSYISYTANGSRDSIRKLNTHCLGCHSTPNATTAPFVAGSTTDKYSPEQRLATPKAKTSIQSRYSSTSTVTWSMYNFSSATGNTSRFGTNQKLNTKKALSAHGNAINNQMPDWTAAAGGSGEDGNMLDYTRSAKSANRNVLCYDCHNSHGSTATGITSSYSSATGRYKGGLLKTTVTGLGGYTVTYKPYSTNVSYRNYSTTIKTKSRFNPGANICNDCHNDNATAWKNSMPAGNTGKPWNIISTYSSSRAIGGYWSTPYFDNYTVNSTKRTAYKAGGNANDIKDYRKPMGGHFGTSVRLGGYSNAAHSQNINGLCTPCHDPHGVSRALGADRDHGVPLLKGTWVTSPYREDKADKLVKRGGGSKFTGITGGGAVPGYHIDQNTFMKTPAPNNGGAGTTTVKSDLRRQAFRSFNILSSAQNGTNYPNLTPVTFAGLCLECHNQQSLTGTASGRPTVTASWKSKERVHQSVSYWAFSSAARTGNHKNRTHAYTCAKCHAPHVSRLPRLLVTNCLDARHFGQSLSATIASTGASTTTPGNITQSTLISSALGAGRFPGGGSRYSGTPSTAQNPGPWWFQTNGAAGTSPPNGGSSTTINDSNYGSNCHNSSGAGGAGYNPTGQQWNQKTPW